MGLRPVAARGTSPPAGGAGLSRALVKGKRSWPSPDGGRGMRGDSGAGHPLGGGDVGPGARQVRDGDGDVLLQSGVSLWVIRRAVLPAAPQDPCPRAAEGAQRAAVIVTPLTGVGVAVSGPGVPSAGVVREG
jgi:hypothetical protein